LLEKKKNKMEQIIPLNQEFISGMLAYAGQVAEDLEPLLELFIGVATAFLIIGGILWVYLFRKELFKK